MPTNRLSAFALYMKHGLSPPLEMAIVGSPAYFEQHAAPKIPTDLIQHNCLAYRLTSSGSIDRWSFTSSNEETRTMVSEPRGNAVFNGDGSMLQAALLGVGWGCISTCACASTWRLANGLLVRVLSAWCPPFPGFYLYVPSGAQTPAKIRGLMDFLVEQREQLAQRSAEAPLASATGGVPDRLRCLRFLLTRGMPRTGVVRASRIGMQRRWDVRILLIRFLRHWRGLIGEIRVLGKNRVWGLNHGLAPAFCPGSKCEQHACGAM